MRELEVVGAVDVWFGLMSQAGVGDGLDEVTSPTIHRTTKTANVPTTHATTLSGFVFFFLGFVALALGREGEQEFCVICP